MLTLQSSQKMQKLYIYSFITYKAVKSLLNIFSYLLHSAVKYLNHSVQVIPPFGGMEIPFCLQNFVSIFSKGGKIAILGYA